jgi:hypothetical protein
MQRKFFIILAIMLVGSLVVTACQNQSGGTIQQATPPQAPRSPWTPILGIAGDASNTTAYAGIGWVRLGYPTCGHSNLSGQVLKQTISRYHQQGMHVLLTYCQSSGANLFDTTRLDDIAQAGADAVQCGNEQMKQNAATLYVPPERFARFFALCQQAMQQVRPALPIILGAMDPLVVPDDEAKMLEQVHYLDAMQAAMNASVHPGGKWTWRSQILGLIDSWHNGYPSADINNLFGQYAFWAQQLHLDLSSGNVGKHLWVVEGTGCVNGCGIDAGNAREVALSHLLTLITDVQTTMRYHVPFFYFPGGDFYAPASGWIYGVLDSHGHAKPLRQDLPMGSRTLQMTCSSGKVVVADQVQLLAKLYAGCSLPADYLSILQS